MRLRPPGRLRRRLTNDILSRLPATEGGEIRVCFKPNLHSVGRQILSGNRGQPIHGASHLRKREIVLDAALRNRPGELRRIFIHELFHFAWVRLSNATRHSYTDLVSREFEKGARGELGWSADYRKDEFRRTTDGTRNERRWRDYVCESFCDTAAWFFSGLRTHPEFTLSQQHRKARARWFGEYFKDRSVLI